MNSVGRLVVWLLWLVLSPTRVAARWLITQKFVKDFWTMMAWNSLFYFLAICSVTAFGLWPWIPDSLGQMSLCSAMWACVSRINELVFAFFGDALPRSENEPHETRPRLPIDARDRIILLSWAYIEIVVEFGILYVLMQGMFGKDTFVNRPISIADALYFSGVTITTTGYGDIVPSLNLPRIAVFYETLIGIVFIALGLAAYLSSRGKS